MLRLMLVAALVSLLLPAARAAEPKIGVKGGQIGSAVNGQPMGRITCCVLFDDQDRPRACFSLHQPAGGKAEYVYFIVFKPEARTGQPRKVDNNMQVGQATTMEGRLVLGKKELVIKESFALGRAVVVNGEKLHEKLSIGGTEIGAKNAHVFLCDLTAEKPQCTPVDIALPADVPDFSDGEMKSWPAVVAKALNSLRAKSPAVKAFYEPAAE